MNHFRVFKEYLGRIAIIAFTLLVASCSSIQQKQGKPAPDWSRGVQLGQSVIGSVGIYPDSSSDEVHFVWPAESREGVFLHYLRVDSSAKPSFQKDFKFSGQVKAPRILPAGEGRYHLIWAGRQHGESNWSLFHSLLDHQGEFVDQKKQITQGDIDVGEYVIASDYELGVVIVLEDTKGGGLALYHITGDNHLITGLQKLAPQGESPSLWVEESCQFHLTWKADGGIWYASFSGFPSNGINGTRVADIPVGRSGDIYIGPKLGLEGEWVYIFWSVLSTTDTQSGSAKTNYIVFPPGDPQRVLPSEIWTLAMEEQPYSPYEGDFPLSNIVLSPDFMEANREFGIESPRLSEAHGDWVTLISGTSDYIMKPIPMTGSHDGLAVALTVSQDYRLDSYLQVATAIFSKGMYVGYNMATRTDSISDDPVLAVDNDGYLHLVWREGALGREIYYATTAPAAKQKLDRLSLGDFTNFILQGSMDVIASLAFLPFLGFGWILPGFILMGVRKLFKDRENLNNYQTWVFLGISILLFQLTKYATLPTATTYIPFSAWILVPDQISNLLRISVPTFILGISLYLAINFSRRYSNSAVMFYVIYALADAGFTLAIYGVNLLGAL